MSVTNKDDLINAINNKETLITLETGPFLLDGPLPPITVDTVIEGNGLAIERDPNLNPDPGPFGFMSIEGGVLLTLRNLTIQNGETVMYFWAQEGLLDFKGGARLYMDSCQVLNNLGIVLNFGRFVDAGDLVIRNSYFYGNVSNLGPEETRGDIGAINFNFENVGGYAKFGGYDLQIEDCEFDNNTGYQVLAFYGHVQENDPPVPNVLTNDLIIRRCIFKNNHIYANYSRPTIDCRNAKTLTVKDCEFINNKSYGQGGALYAQAGIANISNCDFKNNNVTGAGGAINVDIYKDDAIYTIEDCLFEGNASSGYGSAIFINNWGENGKVNIGYNTFIGNVSGQPECQTIYIYNDEDGDNGNVDISNNDWGDDTDGCESEPYLNPDAPNHEGCSACPVAHTGDDPDTTANPISLRLGEKRVSVTEIAVKSPIGDLAFSRAYRQSELGNVNSVMGLGWNHNHNMKLHDDESGTIIVEMPQGKVHFTQDVTSSTTFNGDAGSTSVIERSGTTGSYSYTLTTSDESEYTFDNTGNLLSRTWSNGESWTYTYANSKLDTVGDGYGRQLKFAYINNSAFDNGQLWRVGDHDADLANPAADDRYVEFGYVQEHLDGNVVANGKPLLSTVRDVRGNVWSYDYYGFDYYGPNDPRNEDDPAQANFMTARLSPDARDANGNIIPDTKLGLEAVAYTLVGGNPSQIMQYRGLSDPDDLNTAELTTTLTFNGTTTVESQAGLNTTHHFKNNVYLGTEDDAANRKDTVVSSAYRPALQVDANGNRTRMRWSADGMQLNRITDAEGNDTEFSYTPENTLDYLIDAEGRKTVYTYGEPNAPRQPTIIKVYESDGGTLIRQQEFEYDDKGRTLEERLIDPADGITVLHKTSRTYYDTTDPDNGLLASTTLYDLQNALNNSSTTYTYDRVGRVIKTETTSLLGSCEFSYTVYDLAGNVVATVCGRQGTTPPTTVAEARAMFDADDSIKKDNRVTIHEYDTLGRRVKTTNNAEMGEGIEQDTITIYDALDRVTRTIVNYDNPQANPYTDPSTWRWDDSAGVWKDQTQPTNQIIDHGADNANNIITDTDYNERGLVRMSQDVLGNVTLYGYNNADQLIRVVQNANNIGYDNSYAGDSDLDAYVPVSDADQDIITEQGYDAAGNLIQTIDPLGRESRIIYDALNRPIRTIQNYVAQGTPETDPADWVWNETNGQWAYGKYDPTPIVHGADLDQNHIQDTSYDPMGRVTQIRDAEGKLNLTLYDILGRATRTIQNYVIQGGSNPADWVWSDGNNRWEYSSSVTTEILHGTDQDQNVITDMGYNTDGQVESTRNVAGLVTYIIYDGLGRVTRTIQNYVIQGGSDPADWVWSEGNNRWEYSSSVTTEISHGTDQDQNVIADTVYNSDGRVQSARDVMGQVAYHIYDLSGRLIRSIQNYIVQGASEPKDWVWQVNHWEDGAGNPIEHRADPINEPDNYDQNLITTRSYDVAGRVQNVQDVRGTQTAFTYDPAGRQQMVTGAVGTRYETSFYTLYDPQGRVLRRIAGYVPQYDNNGQMIPVVDFESAQLDHGTQHDTNLMTIYQYDAVGRPIQVINPADDIGQMTYDKGSQVLSTTQQDVAVKGAEISVANQYRYDGLGRRKLVVNGYDNSVNTEDPALWVWNSGWKESDGTTAIAHGTDNDKNIIAQASYDISGRMTSLREPRGNLMNYTYDQLGRRKSRTNALNKTWTTAFANPMPHGSAITLTDPNGVNTVRSFDQMGRLASIDYGNLANTPDVDFAYDVAGNRERMTEYSGAGFTNPIRETTYDYDMAHRMTTAKFNTDGVGAIEETVSYQYDVSGRRTKMILPGSLEMAYSYNQRGQLSGMQDWDGNYTNFYHDQVGRHVGTRRSNNLISTYLHDGAGRLRRIRHLAGQSLRSEFEYEVDGRGNRTRAYETLAQPTSSVTYDKDAAQVTYPTGTWSDNGSYKETTDFGADLQITWGGDEAILIIGTGNDHSIFDLYLDGVFWRSIDGYSAQSGEKAIHIPGEGTLRVKNRAEQHKDSGGYRLQFKQLDVLTVTYDQQTIDYEYDAVSRLLQADYDSGTTIYNYGYDLSGNLVNNNGVTRTYNAGNQLVNDGTNTLTYDDNGNLTSDGMNVHSWDRANRLIGVGNTSYKYDGIGNRIQQTVSSIVTDYLNDIQPGLTQLLTATTGANTERFVHGLRGIHASEDNTGAWSHYAQDGLGSVRGLLDDMAQVVSSHGYNPIGVPDGSYGAGFGFTGEQTDENDNIYLRARYMNPGMSSFLSLDPFEGVMNRPMSLNGYAWVEGNFPNYADPSGLLFGIGWDDVGNAIDFAVDVWNAFPEAWEEGLENPNGYTTIGNLQSLWKGRKLWLAIVYEPADWAATAEAWSCCGFQTIDLLGLLPLIPSRGLVDKIVTVYRANPIPANGSNIVTGGAFRRLREGGATLQEAYTQRQRLLDRLSSVDPDYVRRRLQDAQASGFKSPFISTTFNEGAARANVEELITRGINTELLVIEGPRSGGIDFEGVFAMLGGRLGRHQDAEMEEFGILDLFLSDTQESKSGFYIVTRER